MVCKSSNRGCEIFCSTVGKLRTLLSSADYEKIMIDFIKFSKKFFYKNKAFKNTVLNDLFLLL